MKAEVVQLDKEIIEKLLEENTNNREVSENKIEEYTNAMKVGDWLDNGESIIVDKNGNLRDGQHRLLSMLKVNKFFKVVLVTDVEPEVMQTIDIGKTRTMADVLKMEGVKNARPTAALIPRLYFYDKNIISSKVGMTNSQGLQYYYKRAQPIQNLARTCERIYKRQVERVLSKSEIGLYHYAIDGFQMSARLNDFLNAICGITVSQNKAASYVFRKFQNAKLNRIAYHPKYKMGLVLKAWNIYLDGNPDISYIKFDPNMPMPIVEKMRKEDYLASDHELEKEAHIQGNLQDLQKEKTE